MSSPEEPTHQWLSSMHGASVRLSHLVNQLTKMLMAGRFERPLDRQPIDLPALLHEVLEDVRPFIEQRHQELVLELSPEVGVIHAEHSKIRDTLDHLLLNAIKFTPDGGQIRVSADRANAVRAIMQDEGVPVTQIYMVAGRADTQPLFPEDPYLAANRRVSITLMKEAPPAPFGIQP